METYPPPAPVEKKKFVLPARNPVTHAAHRREMLLQVTLPLVIGTLILLAAVSGVIYAAVLESGEVSRWADISLAWLLLPVLIVALVVFAILMAAVYGMFRLLGVLPGYARLVQDYFALARDKVRQVSDKVVEPVLEAKSRAAGTQRGREAAREEWEDFKEKARW